MLLYGGIQFYVFRHYRRWIKKSVLPDRYGTWMRVALWVISIGNVLFLVQFVLRWYGWYAHLLPQIFVVYPSAWYFASSVMAFVLLLVKDAGRLLLFLVRHLFSILRNLNRLDSTSYNPIPAQEINAGRRGFLKLSGMTLAAASIGAPVLASLATARDYQINRITLSFDELPVGLDGLTLAQVSDLHSGPFMMEADMAEIFEITNSLSPDIILVTGDFVDSVDAEIPAVYNAISVLKAEVGVFGCLGNHDHFATAEKVLSALESRNVVMLNNRHHLLSLNGEQLTLAGIDDYGSGSRNFARPAETVKELQPDSFKIMLSHRPDFFPEAKRLGMNLTLAGHTHGGQVGIEFGKINLNPVYLVHKYARGLYEEEGKKLYVNVGVGMVGAPIRLVRPEITLFTLRKSA